MRLYGVRPLWETDHYDGIIRGYALYKNRMHFFEVDWDQSSEHHFCVWKYHLYRLTDEEVEVATTRWRDFQEMVGYHCDLDRDGARKCWLKSYTGPPPRSHVTEESRDAFYDKWRPKAEDGTRPRIDFSEEVSRGSLGWFTLPNLRAKLCTPKTCETMRIEEECRLRVRERQTQSSIDVSTKQKGNTVTQ